jgi:hypothetical protein
MAFMKRSHALVKTPQVSSSAWSSRVASDSKSAVDANVIAQYSPDKWLLSHVSIIASVDTDLVDPKDPTSNYHIKPTHSLYVNNNGDSWERELLTKTYHTFKGANNYVEHVQVPELAKGKVIDVALREVVIGKNDDGTPATTLYADILVATSRKHVDLCEKILSGEYNAMSMGCLIQYSICSKCGNRAVDETEACDHIKYFKGNFFHDRSGVKRVIAELCGHKDDPKSVTFIDASWVRNPAFPGAVLRNILSPGFDDVKAPTLFKDDLMAHLLDSDLANDDHHAIPKNASTNRVAEEPPSDADFPSAPEDEPADAPMDAPADEPADAPMDTPEETPAEEIKPVDPEVAKTPIEDIKDNLKETLMNQIKQELVDQTKGLTGEITEGPARGTGNPTIESDLNDSLVREAASQKTASLIEKKYGLNVYDLPTKVASAIMLMSKVGSSKMVKLGYSRGDLLGVLYYMEGNKGKIASSRLPEDALRYIESTKIGKYSKKAYIMHFIIDSGRQPSPSEASKIWKWATIIEK